MQEAERTEEHFDIMTDTGKFRALLVESEKRVLEGVKQVLRDERVSFAKRLKDAVTFFFSQADKP